MAVSVEISTVSTSSRTGGKGVHFNRYASMKISELVQHSGLGPQQSYNELRIAALGLLSAEHSNWTPGLDSSTGDSYDAPRLSETAYDILIVTQRCQKGTHK